MGKHAEHIIIRGQVYRWEEKAPFVKSGKSVQGALEYDKAADKIRCHECGDWFCAMGQHIGQAHKSLGTREYKMKHGLRVTKGMLTPEQRLERSAHVRPPGNRFSSTNQPANNRVKAKTSKEFANDCNMCPPQVITRLQMLAIQLGRTPKLDDVPDDLRHAIDRRHGSWNKALKLAGLEVNQEFYTADCLRDSLIDFYVLNGRLPKTREWGLGRLASYNTYKKHFGSVVGAYKAAGLGLVAMERMAKRGGAKRIAQAEVAAGTYDDVYIPQECEPAEQEAQRRDLTKTAAVATMSRSDEAPSRVAEQLIAAQMVPWRTKANLG